VNFPTSASCRKKGARKKREALYSEGGSRKRLSLLGGVRCGERRREKVAGSNHEEKSTEKKGVSLPRMRYRAGRRGKKNFLGKKHIASSQSTSGEERKKKKDLIKKGHY